MAAKYLSKLNVNGQEYQIKDAEAASGLKTLETDLGDLSDGLASKVGYATWDERSNTIHFYDIQDSNDRQEIFKMDLAIEDKVGYGEYDSANQSIIFYNKEDERSRTELFSIDATDFIKDGMVSDVAISNGNLVITFNTDAGHNAISIPLTDIFNPANYYDKTAMDAALALKADASNVYTKSEADGKFLTEHQSLADYPTISTMNTALGQKANVSDIYTQTEIDNKLAAKANSADLATVATSGSYDDLTDKPVIPEGVIVDAALSDTSENAVQNKVVKAAIDAKQDALQYYNENTENKSANIHIEDTYEVGGISANGNLGVDGQSAMMFVSGSQQDGEDGSTMVENSGISVNYGEASMYYEQSVDDEPTTHSSLIVGENNIGLNVESDVDPMPYSHLNVRQNDISLEVMSDEDHITTFAVNDTGATINDERVLTEPDLDAKQDVISDLATIRSGAALGATALQSYTETDPVFTASAAHGITSQDITAWNAKQDAISDLETIRSGAALGATAYQKPSTGIPASDIADGVIPSLTDYYTKSETYSKTEIDEMMPTQTTVSVTGETLYITTE